MKSLQELYIHDKPALNNLQEYLTDFMSKSAVERVFKREDVTHIADAKELVDEAFKNLDVLFAPKPVSKPVINEAR